VQGHRAAPGPVVRAGRSPAPALNLKATQIDALYGYLFIGPQVLGFLVFVLGALIAVFGFSFERRNLLSGAVAAIGLDNYRQLAFDDPLFRTTLTNTLVFGGGLVPLSVGLAFLLAMLVNLKLAGITIFRALFFAPVVTSAVAWALVWRFMLQGDQGTVNQLLGVLGIHGPNWLREPAWTMTAVIVTRVLKNVGLNMIIFLAALQGMPRDVLEAASVDGASRLQVVRRIILPLLMPTVLMVVVVTTIGSMQVFDHIMLMTQGGPGNATMVLVYYVYYQAFKIFESGYASALAVVLFALSLGLAGLQWQLRQRLAYAEQ